MNPDANKHKLASARRKTLTLGLARTAAFRLQSVIDPDGAFEQVLRA